MSKYRKLHNKTMPPKPKLSQKNMLCSALTDVTNPLFLNLATNKSMTIFKGHSFHNQHMQLNMPVTSVASTFRFLLTNKFDTRQRPVYP